MNIPLIGALLPRAKKNGYKDIDDTTTLMEIGESKALTRIIVEKTGYYEDVAIPLDLIPRDSIARNLRGRQCFLLRLDVEGELHAIEPPTVLDDDVTKGGLPQDLSEILNLVPTLVSRQFKVASSFMRKLQLGLIIGFSCAELFILFLIIMAA